MGIGIGVRILRVAAVVAVTLFAFACAAPTAHAQLPKIVNDVTVPVPIPHGPPVMIHLNTTQPPVGTQTPVQQPNTVFGLLPPTVTGICAAVTPAYLAVMVSSTNYKVFNYPTGYQPPASLNPGEKVKVIYKVLITGMLQVKKIVVLGVPNSTVKPSTTSNVQGSTQPVTQGSPNIPAVVAPTRYIPAVVAPTPNTAPVPNTTAPPPH